MYNHPPHLSPFQVYGEASAQALKTPSGSTPKVAAETGPIKIYSESPYGELVYDRATTGGSSGSEIYDTVGVSANSSVRSSNSARTAAAPPGPAGPKPAAAQSVVQAMGPTDVGLFFS